MSEQKPVKQKKKFDFIAMHQEAPELLVSIVETLTSPDHVVLFNRLSVSREVQYDGRVVVFPGHQLRVVPYAIAWHAISKSECHYASEDGTEELEDWWLVTPEYPTFCTPFTENEEARILCPEDFYDPANEEQFLPEEGKGYNQKTVWRRIKKRPTRPRQGHKPLHMTGPVVAVFQAGGAL